MNSGKVSDRVIVESERVGEHPRQGEILEVLGKAGTLHYRVRWDDGHESRFFPSGNVIFVKEKVRTQ
jgi:hypothetical protein